MHACVVCGREFESVHKRSAHMNKHKKDKKRPSEEEKIKQENVQKTKLIKKDEKQRMMENLYKKKEYDFYEYSDDGIFDIIDH